MRVVVSSEAEDQARRAEQAFSFLPAAAAAIVESGGEELRATDSYQDRTGNLRASTAGRLVASGPDSFTCELVMDQEYASYLTRGHKDLAHFFEVVKEVSAALNALMASVGERFGSKAGSPPAWKTRQRGGFVSRMIIRKAG